VLFLQTTVGDPVVLMKTEPDLEEEEPQPRQQQQQQQHHFSNTNESRKKPLNGDTLKNLTNAILLTVGEPLTCKDILTRAYANGSSSPSCLSFSPSPLITNTFFLFSPSGQIRPTLRVSESTLGSILYKDIRGGEGSRFVKVKPGVFGLVEWYPDGLPPDPSVSFSSSSSPPSSLLPTPVSPRPQQEEDEE
jgi:hypothetical protein